jgi:hypothetical protein
MFRALVVLAPDHAPRESAMIETLFLALVALAPVEAPAAPAWPGSMLNLTSPPAYQPARRTVDNWRFESALSLDLSPILALGVAVGADMAQTPRCVKLNNYWCIKRAGWNGEIAADTEGHVAFASALEGAAVAALLLRRYYVDYGRHSARAIVSHWAPAQCSPIVSVSRAPAPAPRPAETAAPETMPRPPAPRPSIGKMLPQRIVSMGLAPRGIEHTLRARWLAAHGRAGVARPSPAARRSSNSHIAAAETVTDLIRAPTIAEGMGEPPRKPASLRAFANTPPIEPSAPATHQVFNCSEELARIANYATRVAEGVAVGPDEDLKLFSSDGSPTERLPLVMANMAAVEIGPLRASSALIRMAVYQLRSPRRPNAPR